jgi:hypothetical protein
MRQPTEFLGIFLLALGLGVGLGCGPTGRSGAVQAPSNEIVTSAAFAGGARLRPVLAEASDGTALFLHWWDAELEMTCGFEPVDEPEGGSRCLPRGAWPIYEGLDEVFADALCSQRVLPASEPSSGGPRVAQLIDTVCWAARGYFREGARSMTGTVYRKTDAGCLPESSAPAAFHNLEPLTLEAFVGARVVAGGAPGPVAAGQLVAEDGSRAPSGFFDRAGGFDCWPHETTQGMRCLPMSFGWGGRGGVYSDAGCSVPVALPQAGCGDRRSALPYVLVEQGGETGPVAAVHRGGARLSQVFRQQGTAACSPGDDKTVAFAIGELFQLDRFLPASLARVARPSGLVQTVAEVRGSAAGTTDAVTVARFDQLAASGLGGDDCSLATTPDGTVRCVPPNMSGRGQYSDALCTQTIWPTGWDRISVQMDSVEVSVNGAGGVFLPKIDQVLSGGTPHEGPVYARFGADCAVVVGVPNVRQPYRRFAGEIPLADLPALRIVARQ